MRFLNLEELVCDELYLKSALLFWIVTFDLLIFLIPVVSWIFSFHESSSPCNFHSIKTWKYCGKKTEFWVYFSSGLKMNIPSWSLMCIFCSGVWKHGWSLRLFFFCSYCLNLMIFSFSLSCSLRSPSDVTDFWWKMKWSWGGNDTKRRVWTCTEPWASGTSMLRFWPVLSRELLNCRTFCPVNRTNN